MTRNAGESNARSDLLLLTCEHGGNDVPPDYARLFTGAGEALASHRGLDIGALGVAHRVASRHAAPIIFSTTTRLLIDLNRSIDSPSLFSEFSAGLSEAQRDVVTNRFYRPYRDSVTSLIASGIETGRRVVHVGIHSFTDVLNGHTRELDLALLFDEKRPDEAAFCESWQRAMLDRSATLRHRFNEPYRGSDDGLTTALRHRFAPYQYIGLEVEVRQGLLGETSAQHAIADLLAEGLAATLTA